MLFFKYVYSQEGISLEDETKIIEKKDYSFNKKLKQEAVLCKEFSDELENITFYLINKDDFYISFVCLYDGEIKDLHTIDKKADELLLRLNLDMTFRSKRELTLLSLTYELDYAQENDFISNTRDIIERHDLKISGGNWYKEKLIKLNYSSKTEILNDCNEIIVEDELKEEIERIYQPQKDNSFGVPVHYFLNIDNDYECKKTLNILLESLKVNNRVIRNFYTVIDLTLKNRVAGLSSFDIKKIFNMNIGGVVVIYANYQISEDNLFSDEHMITDMFATGILKNATKVTTILCCKHKSQELMFKDKLKDLLLININDSTIKNNKAKEYLEDYAKRLDIEKITGLCDMVEKDISYKPNDLVLIFNKWYKKYVKTIQYPQYAKLVTNETNVETKKEKKIAYNELNEMIGLQDIKKTIDDYLCYAKLQKACAEYGVNAQNTCKHMCFVGNPGTAKTTVARYVAQVLKEQGILSKGQLIEVGRADIVSKYVGGTAPNVKKLFENAVGNVLFIDEAYSLCDWKEGMYGDEAINAIVQEMENKRDDVVVIFAGYKNEMQKFLEKNSGLKSRIASIVEFPDYTEEELLSIAKFQANKMGINISQCEDVIRNLISLAKEKEKYFGNGRFIRNILEKARMKQASRLIAEDKLFGEYLKIMKPEDFEIPQYEVETKIGFC